MRKQFFSGVLSVFDKRNFASNIETGKSKMKSVSAKWLLSEADKCFEQGDDTGASRYYNKYVSLFERGKISRLKLRAAYRTGRAACKVIEAPDFKLAYVPLPKCASTTLKYFMYETDHSEVFKSETGGIHKYYGDKYNRLDLNNLEDYYVFTVVRDPLKRFVSAYTNRILHHRNFVGIPDNVSINDMANNIEDFTRLSKTIARHFLPQSTWLGSKIEVFDDIYDISEVNQLTKKINQMTNLSVETLNLQTGGSGMKVDKISKDSLANLVKYYSSDFELLQHKYDREETISKFEQKYC